MMDELNQPSVFNYDFSKETQDDMTNELIEMKNSTRSNLLGERSIQKIGSDNSQIPLTLSKMILASSQKKSYKITPLICSP